jgi:hypothetical protein
VVGGVVIALLLVALVIFLACRTRTGGAGNGATETALQSLPQEAPVYAPSAPAPAIYASLSTAVTYDAAFPPPIGAPKPAVYGAIPERGSPRYDAPTSAFEF